MAIQMTVILPKYISFFYIVIFQNRMKRSSSSVSKENILKGCFIKPTARNSRPLDDCQKTTYTQSVMPEFAAYQSHNWKPSMDQFYSTFGCNNFIEKSRPESKQAFRKYMGRPETSKGGRTYDRLSRKWRNDSKDGFHSQYTSHKSEERGQQKIIEGEIEIIVTKSKRARQKGGIQSKFETDLDDQFLQLFAN